MGENNERIVTAEATTSAPAEVIFELIAEPSEQPKWDGNDNLEAASPGQRVHKVGDVFRMLNKGGAVRDNIVIEFTEGRVIAWQPAPVGEAPRGHTWKWEVEPLANGTTLVRHTYDWTGLTDESRFARARFFTAERLRESLTRLIKYAEEIAAA